MSSNDQRSPMSPGEQRTTIVGVMWFAIGLIGIAMAASGGSALEIFGLVLVALLATLILMREPGQGTLARAKRKRQQPAEQLAMLMEILDEDERAAFKAMLKQRMLDQFDGAHEGELPTDADTLAALLGDHDQDRAASG